MKWLILVLCGLGLLVLLQNMADKDATGVQKQVISMPSAPTNGNNLLAENRQLRDEIVKLNAEIERLKTEAVNKSPSHNSAAFSQQPIQKANPEPAIMQAQFEEFNNFLTKGNDSFVALETSFANEAVDASWANEHQLQLETFFKNSFTDVFPQYIECRSKRCKVTLPVADKKKFSELSETIMQGVLKNDYGIARKIIIEPTTNDGTLNFYLAKNDEVSLLQ